MSMQDAQAQRRLAVVSAHFQQGAQQDAESQLQREPTAAGERITAEETGLHYTVTLPERLSDEGPWAVRRCRT